MVAATGHASIAQQRITASGELRRWELDAEAVAARFEWAAGPGEARMRAEAAEMAEHFPTWVACVGRIGAGDYWESGELVPHAACGAPFVFDRGVRCGDCGQQMAAADVAAGSGGTTTLLLGFAGRVPAPVDDRPFLERTRRHLRSLRDAGVSARAAEVRSYFVRADGRTFFAPPVFAFLPVGWPRTDPLVMVDPAYFAVLDIPPSHVYPGTSYRLCNYAQWRDVTLRTVLQQRIVPRVLIDVMLADLRALGQLEEALDEAGLDVHSIYNVVGRTESAAFSRVYERRRGRAGP